MSSVVISGDTSGAITLAAPAVAGTNTITLPASTGTVMVNGPVFSAYAATGTSVSSGTYTKISFDTEEFDTNSNFASNRFTPTVAGYYQLNSGISLSGNTTAGYGVAVIYKNGTAYKQGSTYASTTSSPSAAVSSLVYFNGSTDYAEIYVITAVSITTGTGSSASYFNGAMVRSA